LLPREKERNRERLVAVVMLTKGEALASLCGVHASARRPLWVFGYGQEVLDETHQRDGEVAKLAGSGMSRLLTNRSFGKVQDLLGWLKGPTLVPTA
jgi:hypothetical protein